MQRNEAITESSLDFERLNSRRTLATKSPLHPPPFNRTPHAHNNSARRPNDNAACFTRIERYEIALHIPPPYLVAALHMYVLVWCSTIELPQTTHLCIRIAYSTVTAQHSTIFAQPMPIALSDSLNSPSPKQSKHQSRDIHPSKNLTPLFHSTQPPTKFPGH